MMDTSLRQLLFVIAALLMTLPVYFAVGGDVLDIILRAGGSKHTGKSIKGLTLELISNSHMSLEAVTLNNVSALAQFRLVWYKDGNVVNTSLLMPRNDGEEEEEATVCCSLKLSISGVNGSKSGNYSVMLLHRGVSVSEAHVNIVFGETQAVAFKVVPTDKINCSAENSSAVLSYSAVGFPTPMYQLLCTGWDYISELSGTGTFVIPPEVCCAGAACRAKAFNDHEQTFSKESIVHEQPSGPICRQYIECLSPRLDVVVQSSTSGASGNIVNGRAINISVDDSVAALTAVTFRRISTFTLIRLDWIKDGHAINAPSNVRMRYCEGRLIWGSWMSCRLRLPFSALNGNLSGNYTVTLYTNRVIASTWVLVTFGGEGLQKCSLNNDRLASPSPFSMFPFTCLSYNYTQTTTYVNEVEVTSDVAPTNATTEAVVLLINNNNSLLASAVTLGTLVVAAIIAIAVCNRYGSLPKQVSLRQNPVFIRNRHYDQNDGFTSVQFASLVGSDSDQACIEGDRAAAPTKLLHYEHITPIFQLSANLEDDVEVDRASTSVMIESTTPTECSPQATSCAGKQCADQQPPFSTERSIVREASTSCVVAERRQSVTVIIHAQNVQVGAINTMVVHGTANSSAGDSDYGTASDTGSCRSSTPVFEECGAEKESAERYLPESDFSCQVGQHPQEGNNFFA